MASTIKIALAGNPNSGKTTIFNAITGARQHVANYAGVTVERKEGYFKKNGADVVVVDLPGTYSLTAYSVEEKVARDFLLDERPDVVVNVVDASNLERNLYLTVQLMELGLPVVIALNMTDVAKSRGVEIDIPRLSALLGIPIVATVGTKSQGVESLVETALAVATGSLVSKPAPIRYGREIEEEIAKILDSFDPAAPLLPQYPSRWLAVKLLEEDSDVVEKLKTLPGADAVLRKAAASIAHLRGVTGDTPEIVLADRRYGFISGACQESVASTVEMRHIMSDKIDVLMTHRVLGIPILLVLMYGVFYAAFYAASAPGEWIGSLLGWLGFQISAILGPGAHGTLTLRSLIVDGVIGGVGSVIVFLPNVMVLFLAIAVLEDSGYMARAAFVMDHLMHKMGLHGKSFIPMIIGFGCSVPAIMSTRIIENRLGRLTTMMVIPLMSCGARLPIYALLIPAFFAPQYRAAALWFIYVFGVLLAIAIARLLRGTVLKGESHPLVMELPPYRFPTVKGLLIHTWERSWLYVKKAGTIILAASVLLWFAANWPAPPADRLAAAASPEEAHTVVLANSLVGRVGRAIEPVIAPLGFDWRAGTALIGATAAKEVFVAQMGIVFGVGESADTLEELRGKMRANYSQASGIAMLLFALIASPCVATVAITRKESGSWKWALLQWGGLTAVGYMMALVAYQVASRL